MLNKINIFLRNDQKINSNNLKIYLLFIFILSFLVRLYDLNYEGYWFDELFTFYVSDPNISFYESYIRIIDTENNNFYQFILKIFFLIFGYNDFNGRLFVVITGSLIPVVSTIIYYNHISKNKIEILLVSSFLIINYFLIVQSQELRAGSFLCLIALININHFLKFDDFNYEKDNKFYINLFFINILSLLISIFSLIFIFSQILTYIYFRKKNSFLFVIFLSIIIFVLINIEQIVSQYNIFKYGDIYVRDIEYEKNFFLIYYFQYYFGSIIISFFYLFIFFLSVFKKVKYKKYNFVNVYIFATVIISYIIPIIFNELVKPILQAKYIIYVVPLIIIFIISNSFKNGGLITKYSILFIFFLTILNSSYQIFISDKNNKPMYKILFEKLNLKNEIIYVNAKLDNFHDKLLINYLNNMKYSKKNNLQFKLYNNNKFKENIYFFCNDDFFKEKEKFKVVESFKGNKFQLCLTKTLF